MSYRLDHIALLVRDLDESLAFLTGVFLFRRAKTAIAISALSAVVVAVSAVLFVPSASGPGILFLIGLAVAGGLYAALSFRVLFGAGS